VKKILIIEDDEAFLKNAIEILELSSYEVAGCRDGKTGVRKAGEWNPDMILCDIMIPHLDGFGVLQAIRNSENLRNVLFIFITGRPDQDYYRKGMELGADDFLSKPFSATDLIKAVETRFKRHELTNSTNNLSGIITTDDFSKTLELFLKKFPEVPVRKGAPLFESGQIPRFICYMRSGLIRRTKTDYAGKELTSALHTEGDFIGLVEFLNGTVYKESATALMDSYINLIPVAEFFTALQEQPGLCSHILRQLAIHAGIHQELLINLAWQDMRGKVAFALIRLHRISEKMGSPDFTIKQSRQVIASLAGVAKESAIRVIIEFIEAGFMESTPDGFIIKDLKKLQNLSG
jgi:CRP/FNR family cyclic AMP-dependent transcriptional regulator